MSTVLKLLLYKVKATLLAFLATDYQIVYKNTKVLANLDIAIDCSQTLLDITPVEYVDDRANRLQSLASKYSLRYEHTKDLDDLEISISRYHEALEIASYDDPSRPHRLLGLSQAHGLRYERNMTTDDLDYTIAYSLQALDVMLPDDSHRAGLIYDLGVSYKQKHRLTGELDYLEESIKLYHEFVEVISESHPGRAIGILGLAETYRAKYDHTKASEDLAKSIHFLQETLVFVPQNHPQRECRLRALGDMYLYKYHLYGAPEDVLAAVRYLEQVIDLIQQDNPKEAARLKSLCFKHSQIVYDLLGFADRESQDVARSVFGPEIDRSRFFLSRHELSRTLDIDFMFRSHASRSDPDERFSKMYDDGFLRDEDLDDLDDAVERCQKDLDLISRDHPDRGRKLVDLSAAYHRRYLQIGVSEDLETAIQRRQEALDLAAPKGDARAYLLHGSGNAYYDRFERKAEPKDLWTAIERLEEAVALTLGHDAQRKYHLLSLGNAYWAKFCQTGTLEDLRSAIGHYREACRLESPDEPFQALQRFAAIWTMRNRIHLQWLPLELVDLARDFLINMLTNSPRNIPNTASTLLHVGNLLLARYAHRQAPEDVELMVKCWTNALWHESAPPDICLRSRRELLCFFAAQNHEQADALSLAYTAASKAISCVPLLTTYFHAHLDRQSLLKELVNDLASDASTVALRAEKPVYEAIRLLETGRGIITSSSNDLRVDVTDLQQTHPSIAQQFNNLRNLPTGPKDLENDNQRRKAAKEFERLIQEIRKLPNFSNFLLVPSEPEIMAAATPGPIVIVNVSQYGSYALIVEDKKIYSLELPLLRAEELPTKIDALSTLDRELMEWLWFAIASPVLDALGYVKTPEHTWPRVWWILTGSLAKFPIHAAGVYDGTYDTVLDRVVSSYSSSIKALIQSQKNLSSSMHIHQGKSMVLVGMAETPGHGSLPFVSKEIKALTDLGTSIRLQIEQPLPHQKEVLSAIDGCRVFHFAGHGFTDGLNPSNSALILEDGNITVENLLQINNQHQRPFLAYLSACGTGQTKYDKLMDEGLHLIGACQLASFQHVIGTLWSVNDESCVTVARKTYEWLARKDMSNESISEALHVTMRSMRSQWIQDNNSRKALRHEAEIEWRSGISSERDIEAIEDLPLYWVPYVHFGT